MHDDLGLEPFEPGDAIIDAAALARALRGSGDVAISVWATGEWRALLFLAWASDALRRAKVNPKRVRLAGDLRATWPLAYLNPERIRWVATRAQPFRDATRRAALELWEAFTADQPDRLERIRRTPPLSLPTLPKALSPFAALLPRSGRRGSSRLRLSAVDEAILGSLSQNDWRRFPDLVRSERRTTWPFSGVFAMIGQYGDLFIQARLARWAQGAAPAAERMPVGARSFPTAYRLSARGATLLAQGFESLAEMPEVVVGGYRSSAKRPWICHQQATSWSLQPL
jgi:hypothetical protein